MDISKLEFPPLSVAIKFDNTDNKNLMNVIKADCNDNILCIEYVFTLRVKCFDVECKV